MDLQMQKQRMTRWLGRFVAALLLALFATASPAQAAVESVAPVPDGGIWLFWDPNNWSPPTSSPDVACNSGYNAQWMPGNGYVYVGSVPNQYGYAGLGYRDCIFKDNTGRISGGGGSIRRVPFPPVCPVPTVNPTVPYSYNVTSGMCEREASCLAPNVLNPATGQCVPPETYTIKLDLKNATLEPSGTASQNAKTTQSFTATVTSNMTQQPKAGAKVTIKAEVEQGSGGHDHTDQLQRPKGYLGQGSSVTLCDPNALQPQACITGTTDANGQFTFVFGSPEPSGKHTITATCDVCNGNQDQAEIKVMVDGLKPIPAFQFYALVEANGDVIGAQTGWHTDNHNLTPAAAQMLMQIAFLYRFLPQFKVVVDKNTGRKDFPPVLHINDASLPWGGVYDICARPGACPKRGIIVWKKPHKEHRRGTVVDVRANGADGSIPTSNKAKFINLLIERGMPYLQEDRTTSNEHFHLRLMGKKE